MNLLTATVHRVGVASPPTPQTLSFPVDEVFLCAATDATNAAIQAFVEHRGKKYYCAETVAELVSAVGSGLLLVSVTEKDGRPIPATQMAFPLEDCALSGVGSGTGYVEYKGKKYYAASFVVGGAPFSGTASELRDALGGVFGGQSDIDPSMPVACWGDSLTAGTGGTPYPTQYCKTYNLPIYNGGVGGETSTQIKTRMLAATHTHGWRTVIWAGTNNRANPETIKSDIAEMVAALAAVGNTDYLIIGAFNSSAEGVGTANYNNIISLAADLAATYGAKFVDIRAYLLTCGDGSAQDLADAANGIIPSSLRSDTVHLTTASYQLVAQKIKTVTGWALTGQDRNALRQVFASNVQLTHTGTTAEKVLLTIMIPPSIGRNGTLIFEGLAVASSTSNLRRVRVRVNDTAVLIYDMISTHVLGRFRGTLSNRGILTAQVGGSNATTAPSTPTTGYGSSASAASVYAFDTAEPLTVTVTAINGVSGDMSGVDGIQIMALG